MSRSDSPALTAAIGAVTTQPEFTTAESLALANPIICEYLQGATPNGNELIGGAIRRAFRGTGARTQTATAITVPAANWAHQAGSGTAACDFSTGAWHCRIYSEANPTRYTWGTLGASGADFTRANIQENDLSMMTGGAFSLSAPSSLPATSGSRITQSDLTWLGAFKAQITGMEYNGDNGVNAGLALNSAGNGLFMVGSRLGANTEVIEIGIPAVSPANTTEASLPNATVLQARQPITRGLLTQVEGSLEVSVTGLYVANSRLWFAGFDFYDGAHDQVKNIGSANLTLATNDATGMGTIQNPSSTLPERFWAGYFERIPAAAKTQYGITQDYVMGRAGGSNFQSLSAGPSLIAVNFTTVTGTQTVTGTPLMYYEQGSGAANIAPSTGRHLPARFGQFPSTVLPVGTEQGTWTTPWWNGNSSITGCAWINDGTKKCVLFAGQHGSGTVEYGVGQNTNPGAALYDPVIFGGGNANHSWPYFSRIMAYDESEIGAVAQGTKQPWEAVPYATWTLSNPTIRTDTKGSVVGMCADHTNKKLYVAISSQVGGANAFPTIHVYQWS